MRFGSFYLNGFGIHHDRRFDLDGQAPATLFYGRNEAGKSTLMAFIRSMLFGFPTRARMHDRYEPLGGGSHGGYLTLIDENGTCIQLERYEKNGYPILRYPDGSETGEAALRALLGGLTPELYRNLFAFSLTELQKLETLHSDDVGGFLFSSGTGLRAGAIMEAEKSLGTRLEQLYKPRGSKQPINIMLRKLETSEAELRRSKAFIGQYHEKLAELEALELRLTERNQQLQDARVEADWLNKCVQVRHSWIRLREIQRELESDLWGKEQEANIHVLLEHSSKLHHLLETAKSYQDEQIRFAADSKELENEQANLERTLRLIDPHYTLEQAMTFPASILRQEELSRYQERYVQISSKLSAASERLEGLNADVERSAQQVLMDHASLEKVMEIATKRMPAPAWTDLEGYEALVRRALDRARTDASLLGQAAARAADMESQEQALRSSRGSRQSRQGSSVLSGMALHAVMAVAAGAVVALLIGLITDHTLLSLSVGAGAVVAVFGLLRFVLSSNRHRGDQHEVEALLRDLNVKRSSALRETEECQRRYEASVERLSELFRDAGQLAEAAAGLTAVRQEDTDFFHVNRRIESIADQVEQELVQWRKMVKELEHAKQQKHNSELRRDEWIKKRQAEEQRIEELTAQWKQIDEQWQDWLAQYGLSPELKPETVMKMGQYAEDAIATSYRIDGLQAKLTAMRSSIAKYEEEAVKLLTSCQMKVPSNPLDFIMELKKLRDRMDDGKQLLERRKALEMECMQLESSILKWVTSSHREKLDRYMTSFDESQLARELAERETAITQLEHQISEMTGERGRMRGELEQLLGGDAHSELLLEHQECIAEFEQLSAQYIQLALTNHLIRSTRDIYEKERQPGVLRQTSVYFREITEGRYTQVMSKLGEKDIYVMNEKGELLGSAFLSRGTAEQLYLSMRFALADEYAKTVSLPLVMDDIFVNFDQERLKRTLSVLAEVAKKRQILLFTCHEHVANRLQETMPDMQLIAL